MQKRICTPEFRHTVVCVDAYDENILQGRLYHPDTDIPMEFRGLMKLILAMEELLKKLCRKDNEEEIHRFVTSTETGNHLPEPPRQSGKRATFLIRVLFRQNASWQGSILWMEGRTEQSFRSVLELALLMDSALRPERRGL